MQLRLLLRVALSFLPLISIRENKCRSDKMALTALLRAKCPPPLRPVVSRVLLLPLEIWCSVMAFLHFSSGRNGHVALRLTCRRLHDVMETDAMWRSELVAILAALEKSRLPKQWLTFKQYERLVHITSAGKVKWSWRHAFLHLLFSRVGRCILCCRSSRAASYPITRTLRDQPADPTEEWIEAEYVAFPFSDLSICETCADAALEPISSLKKGERERAALLCWRRGRYTVLSASSKDVGTKRPREERSVTLHDPLHFLSGR